MHRVQRLGSRTRPRTVAVLAASRSHPWPFRSGRKNSRLLEPEIGVDTVEQTRRTFEAAPGWPPSTAERIHQAVRAVPVRQCGSHRLQQATLTSVDRP